MTIPPAVAATSRNPAPTAPRKPSNAAPAGVVDVSVCALMRTPNYTPASSVGHRDAARPEDCGDHVGRDDRGADGAADADDGEEQAEGEHLRRGERSACLGEVEGQGEEA